MSGKRELGIYRKLLYFLWDFSVSLETALIDTTPLCKLNAQVTFPQNSLTSGSYQGLFDLVLWGLWLQLGELQLHLWALAPIWSVLAVKGNSVYKALWTRVTGLVGLGGHIWGSLPLTLKVAFWLVRFWFDLITLV